jgi:predicted ATPase
VITSSTDNRRTRSTVRSSSSLNLSPQRKREKFFEAVLSQLAREAAARRRPVLTVFEDVHWIRWRT